MKLIITFMLTSSFCLAQSDGDQLITVPKKYVSPSGIAQSSVSSSADSVHGYVGIGHEVGEAMKEGLSAFTEETQHFASTTPGKFTMFVIAYKTIGKDMIRLLLAFLLMLIGIPIWIRVYLKSCFPIKYMKNEIVEADGKVTRNYEIREADMDGEDQLVYFGTIIVFLTFCVLLAFG